MKRLLIGVLMGLTLALLPVGASAATTITEVLNGVETGVPPPCLGGSTSPFSGTAQGDLQGVWWASICHGALPKADIFSGTFTLRTPSRQVLGFFHYAKYDEREGTGVRFTDEQHFAGACQQHYSVSGPLGNSVSGPNNGWFWATLTHYGAYYWGSCHVFSARVSGQARLTI
jgi:hypothetical protein